MSMSVNPIQTQQVLKFTNQFMIKMMICLLIEECHKSRLLKSVLLYQFYFVFHVGQRRMFIH
jgi:hypothetical protein